METILMLMTSVVLLCYSTSAVTKERPETFWHERFCEDHNIKIHLPTSTSPNHTLVRTGGNRGNVRITGRRFSLAERNDSRKCACVLKLEHMTRVQIYMKHNKQSPKRFKSAAFKLLATANTIPITCSFEIRRRYSLNGNNNPRHDFKGFWN